MSIDHYFLSPCSTTGAEAHPTQIAGTPPLLFDSPNESRHSQSCDRKLLQTQPIETHEAVPYSIQTYAIQHDRPHQDYPSTALERRANDDISRRDPTTTGSIGKK